MRHAHSLFLMVPQALHHSPTMTPKKEYAAVVKRMGSFFTPGTTPTFGDSTSSGTDRPRCWSTLVVVVALAIHHDNSRVLARPNQCQAVRRSRNGGSTSSAS